MTHQRPVFMQRMGPEDKDDWKINDNGENVPFVHDALRFVYGLVNEGRIVYVGSSVRPSRRVRGHTRKKWDSWIVIDVGSLWDETFWISAVKAKGHPIVNVRSNRWMDREVRTGAIFGAKP